MDGCEYWLHCARPVNHSLTAEGLLKCEWSGVVLPTVLTAHFATRLSHPDICFSSQTARLFQCRKLAKVTIMFR